MSTKLGDMAARPSDRRRLGERDVRVAILEAARRRFLRFGPRKTTMEEIAREARLSRATVYAHFRNKEDVYAKLLEADAEAFIREAKKIIASRQDAAEKLRAMVELTRVTYTRNHVMRQAVTGDGEMCLEPVARAFARAQEKRIIGLLRRVLAEGVAEGSFRRIDPDRVAYLMFHLGSFLVERETSGLADYPFEQIIGVMDDVFGRGIARAGRSATRGRTREW